MNAGLRIAAPSGLGSLVLLLLGASQEEGIRSRAEDAFREWRGAPPDERWTRYVREIQEDGALQDAFFGHLREEGQFEFLEEVVLYGRDAQSALRELTAADAPGWLRCAVWCLDRRSDSHTWESARSSLLERADLAFGWFEAHPPSSPEALRVQDELRAAGAVPRHDPRYLPAYDRAFVLRALDPNGEVVSTLHRSPTGSGAWLGAALSIERALEGFSFLLEHPEPWREWVTRLTGDEVERVRLCAYRSLTRFRPREIPVEHLWRDVGNAGLERTAREHALLAWSFGPDDEVYVRLHEIALDPDHPAWFAALSRLGDLGDEFTLDLLARLREVELSPPAAAHREAELGRISERLSALAAQDPQRGKVDRLRRILTRVAWADLNCHRLEEDLRSWMQEILRAWSESPEVVAALRELATSFEPDPDQETATLFGDLRSRVRSYARELAP